MNENTRRQFMKMSGATAATAISVPGVGIAQKRSSDAGWTEAKSPTTKTLHGVVDTAEGPFAVGSGGDVLARRQSGWQKVVEYGPMARSRPLTAVDVTSDGKAIWFVGGSGVIGEYDVATETLTNYSAPKGKTSTWEACSVVGKSGENERLYFANGSGELLIGVRQKSGAVKYLDVLKPGGGSTIPAIDFRCRKKGHVCSTSQFVAESTNGGTKWQRIGIDFAGGAFFDLASVGPKDVNVAGGGGIVYRYDGFRWTPHVIDPGKQAIRGIDRDGEAGLAAGSGGKTYERQSTGEWKRFQTPVSKKLTSIARGKTHDVAVGSGGTIVERKVNRTSSSLPDTDKTVKQYTTGTVETV
ncbi:WD40/YVTN/BNR-like repeat-containing protein [Halococcus sp. AFM35]|uniref:WD40/YVTN/BNR-like repeat-containing protein n=1 Tax=Halococcus sp. AFM35 TaxID=3421653 RepID=UPI003EB7F28E